MAVPRTDSSGTTSPTTSSSTTSATSGFNMEEAKKFAEGFKSGSGSKSKGVDYAKSFETNQAFRFEQLYVSLWGEKPSPSYIMSKVKAGWSTTEFEFHERNKPAFKKSPRYAEEGFNLSNFAAEQLGAFG